MFYSLARLYYRIVPKLKGWLFKFLFAHKRLVIGKNFKCDSFPKVLLDKSAHIKIGDNVLFRRNVELRAHGESKLEISENCRIDRGVRILSANNARIHLQNGVRVGLYSVFNGGDSIEIGKKSLISGFVYLQTSMHNYQGSAEIQDQGYIHGPVKLGDNCWLGTHVVVFPNVILGSGSIVGSSAVVNKSFAKNSIIAGIPAKLIKHSTE